MNLNFLPPEVWTLGGVIIGTLIPAIFAFMNGRQQAQHESNKVLIEALERRIGDLEKHLRNETDARRTLEVEVRLREQEAHATADQARLVMSIAVAHIHRLGAHIEAGSPPPPPPLPSEVAEWISRELWTSKLAAPDQVNKPPAT
jgi:hypothetical protein|nr:MAG TPA: Protein of unknown function (DUF2730) [Caudoviricetes sp.]